MFIEIKDCPYCGSNNIDFVVNITEEIEPVCTNCGCIIDTSEHYDSDGNFSRALKLWNSRFPRHIGKNNLLT